MERMMQSGGGMRGGLRALRVRLLLVGGLAAVVLASTPATGRTQSVALEAYEGGWSFSRSRRDVRGLEQAIDHVVDQLNFFIREIARGEMRRRITPESRVRFNLLPGARISLAIDEWGPMTFDLGAQPRRVRGPNGDDIRVAVAFQGGRLVHREIHSQGHRTNVFALSGDGARMTMHATIGSDQLPDDVRYRLTYRRQR